MPCKCERKRKSKMGKETGECEYDSIAECEAIKTITKIKTTSIVELVN